MNKTKKTTLSDVAKLSGVSVSTVSMIINKRSGATFSSDTIEKVMEAARDLEYVPKSAKQAPAVKVDQKMIAVICPNVTNPYYATIVQSIQQSSCEAGYDVTVFNTFRDPEVEKRVLTAILNMGISGIIFAMIPSAPGYVEQLSVKLPVVVIGDRDSSIELDTVETSNYAAGVLIGKHLIDLGHKHVAYISTTLDSINTARTKRLEGLMQSFKEAGDDHTVLVKSKSITPELECKSIMLEHAVGFALCQECLQDKKITAFVGVNDMVAYGIMDAVLTAGYQIPTDYSIAGFDNNFPSHFLKLSLTTVDHNMEQKGHTAFGMLFQKMIRIAQDEKPSNCITRVEYQQRLIARGSTGEVRRKSLRKA